MANLINQDFEEQEKKNREKYGPRDDDHIASCFKQGIEVGNIWCSENVKKYLKRFTSKSSKSKNPLDALKCIDYLVRMYEANKEAGVFEGKTEIIDK